MNRIADVLFEPLFLALVAIALGAVLHARSPRVARVLPPVAGLLLLVFSLPGVANRLQWANEQPALTSVKPDVTYDAVIVLGGATYPLVTLDTGAATFGDPVERVLTAFDLLRTNRARFAILSGSSWSAGPGAPPSEGQVLADQLIAWGIDRERLVIEDASRTTHENAVESARVARARGWTRVVLVTSAAHMKRAYGCFAEEGLPVDTLAVDFDAYDPSRHGSPWLPRASALAESTAALRERIGRAIYQLRGWSR